VEVRPADFIIVETARADGFFHVKRKVNSRTACDKMPKDLPLNFAQGARALLTLKNDPGCCETCRETVKRMFDDTGAN